MNCRHLSCAIGETFTRCLSCLSWRFTVGVRWWPEHYELPWEPNGITGPTETYQVAGIQLEIPT